MSDNKPNYVCAAEIEKATETTRHPLNPNSMISGTHLSRLTGLERVGISLVVVPPDKESFIYHSHYCEEEWIYILSGSGVAEIGDDEFVVGPGDFMGFPAPSIGHHLRNAGKTELTYLMGGENCDVEIADFPKLGKRMLRRGEDIEIYDIADSAKPNWNKDT